jgi:hypothetical protein
MHQLNGGQGIIELSWPAPAMPLETQPLYIAAYLLFFLGMFPFILVYLNPRRCALPLIGFGLLVMGHFGARYVVERQRSTLSVSIPKMDSGVAWNNWLLVDKPRFPTTLARRSFFTSPKGVFKNFRFMYASSRKSHITLSQHHQFQQPHTRPVVTVLTLAFLCGGFFVFYLGVKSSNLPLVISLLITYILANILKGWIALRANTSYRTRLNNPGHPRVDRSYSYDEWVDFLEEELDSQPNAREDVSGVELGVIAEGNAIPGNAHPSSTTAEEAP